MSIGIGLWIIASGVVIGAFLDPAAGLAVAIAGLAALAASLAFPPPRRDAVIDPDARPRS